MTFRNRIIKAHPATLVLTSFLLAIAVGASLLKLPAATRAGSIAWMDAVFTATSAVCVTGLTVVDTGGTFSLFGQAVILGLIQVGGLGVMTVSVALFRWLGRSVPIRHRMAMQDLFAHTPRADIFTLVKSTVLFTLAAELLGAALLTLHWLPEYSSARAIHLAVFHAISAFCNAGFALFPDNLMRYSDSILLNLTICGLIVVGGIGFPVLYDLQSWVAKRKTQRVRLSVHSKTVLWTTLILIVAGALMIAFLERHGHPEPQTLSQGILTPLFQSITCRTAGFNTVDIASLSDATLAMMLFLMFFGASPGSCGGGVKTTTLALLSAFTLSRIARRRRVNMFRKSIPVETVTRSTSLVLVSLSVIGLVLFLLLVGDSAARHGVIGSHDAFLVYLFETVSAFGTVGHSMGVTPELTNWGKLWITAMMVVGRVGMLTFAYIIVGAGPVTGFEHSEENVMIG